MSKIIPLLSPSSAEERANTNAERQRRLFEWAIKALAELGLAQAMAGAAWLTELCNVVFDVDDPAVALAVRDALHPATGKCQDHFRHLREGALKRILRNRFDNMKRDREKVLRKHAGGRREWSDDLILNQFGEIVPNLANLILILRKNPEWEGVLAYDAFSVRVTIEKQPP
jgi:hypothetical protein